MKRSGPDQWRAVVLRDEAENLAILCRMLEFDLGYLEGKTAGAAEARNSVAVRREPGLRKPDPRRRLAVLR
ncbi:hypothetical protein SEA_RENNA12_66 [Arthrobacter phage Renna12]|nr:hypothetical protein SEA_RENNA12_66 [Arthrobacter phage Renna12]